jgi:SanA protein
MKWLWLTIQILLGLLLVGFIVIYVANREVYYVAHDKAQNSITEIPDGEPPRVAIVFGAGVWANGEPSPALYDRIVTAVELYRSKRVSKLLMSGDNRFANYNEPEAMKKTAIKLGVPEADIIEDFAGRRTYDTCYRAREIFEVKRAVLVTQEFHLNRAIYLCESVGIDSYGINADRRQYPQSARSWWAWRETFAIASAWLDVHIWQPTPILGKKEPITP